MNKGQDEGEIHGNGTDQDEEMVCSLYLKNVFCVCVCVLLNLSICVCYSA